MGSSREYSFLKSSDIARGLALLSNGSRAFRDSFVWERESLERGCSWFEGIVAGSPPRIGNGSRVFCDGQETVDGKREYALIFVGLGESGVFSCVLDCLGQLRCGEVLCQLSDIIK